MLRGYFSLILTIGLLCLIPTSGCSYNRGGSASPVDSPVIPSPEKEAQSGRVLWGIWQFSYDESIGELTAIPLREAYAHFNITPMLLPPNCTDCLKIKVNSFNPVTHILDADVTLRNPTQLIGHDVRGILFTNDYGHSLTNADDWTGLWDIAGGQTINPFKAFAKGLSNRIFAASVNHTENYLIYIPVPPHYEAIKFAVDASFPSNCKEPYEITNFLQGTIYDISGSSSDIYIDVHDWQHDVDKVTLIAPEITGEDTGSFVLSSGDTWTLKLINNLGVAQGDYPCRVVATSLNSPGLPMYDFVRVKIEAASPVVTSIIPDSGYVGKDISGAKITGGNFQGPQAEVKLRKSGEPDIIATNVFVAKATEITCDIAVPPDATPGLYDVEVTNENDLTGTGQQLFEVKALLSPGVTGINPNIGHPGKYLQDVTVSGTNFQGPDASVKLKKAAEPDIVATDVVVASSTSITCDISIPLNAGTGFYDVEVTNDSGMSGTGAQLFEVATGPFNPQDVTPPWLFFYPYSIYVEGNYAYMAGWNYNFHIFDVSDPANPAGVSSVQIPGSADQVVASNGYAYLLTDTSALAKLYIIDVNPPEAAYVVKTVDIQDAAYDIAVSGDYVYVGADGDRFLIIDVTPPSSAHVVKTVNTYANDIVVEGDYAYLAAGGGGLKIVDINPPASAYVVNTVATTGSAYYVNVSDGYAYVWESNSWLEIIDIDPPESAFISNTIDADYEGAEMDVDNGYAYVVDEYSYRVHIFDIAPPESAHFIKTLDTPGMPHDVMVSNGYAYIADEHMGFSIIDVSQPESAYIAKTVYRIAFSDSVSAYGGHAYLFGGYYGLQILDCDPPECALALYSPGDDFVYIYGGVASDGYAYATTLYSLMIFDIDPVESPEVVKTVDITGLDMSQVVEENGYVYTVDCNQVFHIVDVDPPESGYVVKELSIPVGWLFSQLDVEGGYAYVTSPEIGTAYLSIVDIDPPEVAYDIIDFELPGAGSVAVHGQYAYVSGGGGLQIIDVSNPDTPVVVNLVPEGGGAGLVYSGGYVYGGGGASGLVIVDVDPPESAFVLTTVPTPGDAGPVAVSDGYAYVLDDATGLRIIKLW